MAKLSRHDVIVAPEQVAKAWGVAEAVQTTDPARVQQLVDPVEQAALMAQIAKSLRALSEEAARSGIDPDLLVATKDRTASLLQSLLASGESADSALISTTAGGRELTFHTDDAFGWLGSLLDRVRRKDAHPIVRPASTQAVVMPEEARIAMLGDWGTGLYGAPTCALSIQNDPNPLWMLLHLGDIYYSGTDSEVQERFLNLWPKRADAISRAVNSNHEMYSGGFAYFDRTLPAFNQKSSYFAYQNEHWLLIALDTAYVNHDIDQLQLDWLREIVSNAGKRNVILFSHQQLFSRLDDQGPDLAKKLGPLLRAGRIRLWYWGHEHRCVFYAPAPQWGGLLARCVGHGGMPYTRGAVAGFGVEYDFGDACLRRFEETPASPRGLVLDGINRYIKGKEAKYGPHGYVMLHFEGPSLTETLCDPDGRGLWKNVIQWEDPS